MDTMTPKSVGIVDGDVVTTVKLKSLSIFSTYFAFAAVKADGSVVTWGNADEGGNCDAVREQLAE